MQSNSNKLNKRAEYYGVQICFIRPYFELNFEFSRIFDSLIQSDNNANNILASAYYNQTIPN